MTKKSTITAVGYGRTSSDDKGGIKVSVPQQRAQFEAQCRSAGWVNAGWFEDRDISGRMYPAGASLIAHDPITAEVAAKKSKAQRTRPGLAAALASGADVLWVRDSTRLMRPLSGSLLAPYIRGAMRTAGMRLWVGDSEIDFNRLEARIVQGLQDEMEDHAVKIKAAQSLLSRNRKRDAGSLYVNPRCLGFVAAGRGKVEVVPSEYEAAKRLFSLYLSGLTIRQVAMRLGDEGFMPAKGGSAWHRRSVLQVLKRPCYAGMQLSTDGTLIESTAFAPYAVITPDQHRAIQARLSKQAETSPARETKFYHPLSGLVVCGTCGRPMSVFRANGNFRGKATSTLWYYKCGGGDKGCTRSLIRETMSAPALIGQSKRWASNPDVTHVQAGLLEFLFPFTLAGYIKQISETDTSPELRQRIAALRADLQAAEAKAVSRYRDYEDGLITRSVYASVSADTKAKVAALTKEIASLEAAVAAATTQINLTYADKDRLQDMDAPTYRSLLLRVVTQVRVWPDRIEVVTVDDRVIPIPRLRLKRGCQLPYPTIGLEWTDPKTQALTGRIIATLDYPHGQSPDCFYPVTDALTLVMD